MAPVKVGRIDWDRQLRRLWFSLPNSFQDYPSVGFLRQVIVDNQVVPIFAITSTNKELYAVSPDLAPGRH